MRVDVVSIFPDYLAPLRLSLPGRAQESGLLTVTTHDLRAWTHDRHRTVDDTPYGGGAGMVMKPEPWGEALDDLVPEGTPPPRLLVPSPAGRRFTQADAQRLAHEEWLVIACGRYEGIDERVVGHAASRMPVEELSVGDYVLNGGEVAAMVMIEAIVRLLPGFMGNPDSLTEESYGAGLLEYPVYTKPARWRGLDVPPVLLSGNHADVAHWRATMSRRRTAERRPDLLHTSLTLDGADLDIEAARPADRPEIAVLERCYRGETDDTPGWSTWVVRSGGRLVAVVRARREDDAWLIDAPLVVPDLADRGLEPSLVAHAESVAPPDVASYRLSRAGDDLGLYRRAGYAPAPGGLLWRRAH